MTSDFSPIHEHGGCSRGTHSFEDQLDRTLPRWKLATNIGVKSRRGEL